MHGVVGGKRVRGGGCFGAVEVLGSWSARVGSLVPLPRVPGGSRVSLFLACLVSRGSRARHARVAQASAATVQ
eukprot:657159-Prymnesium_polylepis.1